MEIDTPNTKTNLILTAGELFAEHGYESVSTRMIAEKAGVNLGGIHYHFGSKDNLHLEIFRYILKKERPHTFADIVAENPEKLKTAAGRAWIVQDAVFKVFKKLSDPTKPKWMFKLFSRELIAPTSALDLIANEICKPEREATIEFFRLCVPESSDDDAHAWADLLLSGIIFYMLSEDLLDRMRKSENSFSKYLSNAARMTAMAMIRTANLPMPDSLKNDAGADAATDRQFPEVTRMS